jgi:hypothetical protein
MMLVTGEPMSAVRWGPMRQSMAGAAARGGWELRGGAGGTRVPWMTVEGPWRP